MRLAMDGSRFIFDGLTEGCWSCDVEGRWMPWKILSRCSRWSKSMEGWLWICKTVLRGGPLGWRKSDSDDYSDVRS